ncbi:beta-D-glucosyl crocetin beta-1,6-glucosyltransferase-like [Solanum stenotomum]|uniref:beta-D-glucosyl crocetin beta-1,6-glucosyltransferase-like n=1 Tax=Solanum stenotomum TaxID=172797 RepID=UPI0020D1E716|nr:beta-D-glucosyl crocetin beta-1,6-glucosyltransferase-like [Solanum stenotomum]
MTPNSTNKNLIMGSQVTEHGSTTLRLLMFPWLAYGHISPFLNVAKKLADRGFLIYLCSTPINLKSTINKISEKYVDLIHLIELHLPELPKLPPHYHTTNEHSSSGLLTFSAAVTSYFVNLVKKPGVKFPVPDIYLRKIEQVKLGEMLEKSAKDQEPDDEERLVDGYIQIALICTSRTIEAKYIDFLSELSNMKIVPVGPPVQDLITNDADDMELMDWLGTKDENSTVFVSFGSEYFLSKEDMEEVAFGLELSNVNFIWVVRFPKGKEQNLEDALPKGFLERIGERGKVLDKFAPQLRILNHTSTGGFISHCGWNSVMESIDFGVPIIAMPMHLDQPMNARLIVELGVAVEIVRDDDGKIHKGEIAETIKNVIIEKTGEKLRGKMRDISKNLKWELRWRL